jgi:hypothetical protein
MTLNSIPERPFRMKKASSLSGHARPKVTMKKRLGFLDLPGETRNQIYDCYFQQGFKCEFAEKDAKLGQKQRNSLNFSRRKLQSNDCFAIYERMFAPVATVRFSRVLGTYNGLTDL